MLVTLIGITHRVQAGKLAVDGTTSGRGSSLGCPPASASWMTEPTEAYCGRGGMGQGGDVSRAAWGAGAGGLVRAEQGRHLGCARPRRRCCCLACLQNLGVTLAWWGCCIMPSRSWYTSTWHVL